MIREPRKAADPLGEHGPNFGWSREGRLAAFDNLVHLHRRVCVMQLRTGANEHLRDPEYRADQLGKKQPAIARLESERCEPVTETLMRLSRELGVESHMDLTPKVLSLSA